MIQILEFVCSVCVPVPSTEKDVSFRVNISSARSEIWLPVGSLQMGHGNVSFPRGVDSCTVAGWWSFVFGCGKMLVYESVHMNDHFARWNYLFSTTFLAIRIFRKQKGCLQIEPYKYNKRLQQREIRCRGAVIKIPIQDTSANF